MHPEQRDYAPGDRPGVEVMVDGRWLVGELRRWSRRDDGTWWGNVQYRPADEPTWHLGTFPSDRIRGPRPETRPDQPTAENDGDAPRDAVTTAIPAERHAVTVRVRGEWLPGRLYFWTRGSDDRWWGRVRWSSGPGTTSRLGTFSAERIRGVDTPVARPGPDQTARPWPEWSEDR